MRTVALRAYNNPRFSEDVRVYIFPRGLLDWVVVDVMISGDAPCKIIGQGHTTFW
jgi:hypothetical protein